MYLYVRMCPLNSQGRENAFPQVGQTHGSVCERMCIFKAPRLLYSLGQCLQKKAGRVAGTVASLLSSLCLLCSCSCASACWSVGGGRCLRDLGSVGLRCVPHLPPHCCCSWRWTGSWGPAGPGYWKGSMTMWDRVGRVTSWHPKSVQWSSKLLGSRWWLLEVLLVGICLAEYLVGERTTK